MANSDNDLVWRPPVLGDVPVVTEHARRCDAADGTLDAAMVGELADRLDGDSGVQEVSRLAFEAGRLVAAGWVRMMAAPNGTRACLYSFAVSEHAAGPELIRWLDSQCVRNVHEARFERILAATTPDAPEGARALYRELGYERFYTELEMTRTVTPANVPAACVAQIVPWVSSSHEQIRRAYNDAFRARGFAGFTPAEWPRAFVPGEDFRESLSFIALDQDAVVGFIFADVRDGSGGWTDPAIRNCGWIDSLGVKPSFHRRAIGSGLMAAACDAMHGAGVERVALRVNDENRGAINLYRQRGFVTVRKHVVYRRLC